MAYGNFTRYLAGVIGIIAGVILAIFYYLFSGPAADAPPTPLIIRLIAFPIGLPLVGAGVALIRKRYRLSFYLIFAAGITYAIIPLLPDFYFFAIVINAIIPVYIPYLLANYLPAIIIFLSLITWRWQQAQYAAA